jgi:hypothetical protein
LKRSTPLKLLAVVSAAALMAAYVIVQSKAHDPGNRMMSSSKLRTIAGAGYIYANPQTTAPAPQVNTTSESRPGYSQDLFHPIYGNRLTSPPIQFGRYFDKNPARPTFVTATPNPVTGVMEPPRWHRRSLIFSSSKAGAVFSPLELFAPDDFEPLLAKLKSQSETSRPPAH